eukprot:s3870_g8.t1
MSLNILCSGDHEHAPWGFQDGVFDTAKEAEYTPQLAKALATTVLESLAGQFDLPHVAQVSKRLKLSHFHSIAADKQPSKLTSLPSVPEFSHIVVVNNLPTSLQFSLEDGNLQQCTFLRLDNAQFLVPCGSKLLRKTHKKGGEFRLFRYSVDCTPSLHVLGDIESAATAGEDIPLLCNRCEAPCNGLHLVLQQPHTSDESTDWVFGVRWSPENFLRKAVQVGHPFKSFSGLLPEVKQACERLAECS